MNELLDYFDRKRYLELGDKQFSPIMKISTGIALDYCDSVNSPKALNSPLFLCFPEKKEASLWLSLALLRNYYVDDYIENATRPINFKAGQKVLIYGCIAEVLSATDSNVSLMFKGEEHVSINKEHWSNMSLADPKRSLNKFKNYLEKKREHRANRNSVSKILEPKGSVVINQDNLDSKVLLVSGRGNVHKFKKMFSQVKLHDEPLSKSFLVDRNITITADLKSYSKIFDSSYEERLVKFKNLLYKLMRVMQQDELIKNIIELYEELKTNLKVTFEFDTKFREFVNEYSDAIPKLKFVNAAYPGLKETIPTKLRAVIINDICQVIEYENTVKALLDQKVPVIIISDRNIAASKDIDFYKDLFINNPHYYRLNWNRKKIKVLKQIDSEASYLDLALWQECNRYAKQVIELDVYPPHELDKLLPKLISHIRHLDNFEVLQKKFYNFLYPALFALKNSREFNPLITGLVNNFKSEFELVESLIQNREIVEDFKNVMVLAQNFEVNTKSFTDSNYLFSIETVLSDGSKLRIPFESFYNSTSTSNSEEILFTGYPYNEYLGRYLINAVNVLFVPKVVVKCWPEEANLTYGYLKRRIKGGYFLDNLGDLNRINDRYLLKSEENIQNEIDSYLRVSKLTSHQEIDDEEPLDYLHTFKYRGYRGGKEDKYVFTTACNIVNFEDGFFMFLPVDSSVLCQSEDNKGRLKVTKLKIDDLNVGDRVFTFNSNRSLYRKLSKSNQELQQHFDKLDLWRETLKSLFTECDEELNTLESKLKMVKKDNYYEKGNPIKSSLQRWLYDEEMISPDIENLRIILKAAETGNLETVLEEMNYAYKSVASFTISLSSEIRKRISQRLSLHNTDTNVFLIDIEGMTVQVDAKQIISIDKNKIEVDYSNTRRFLC